jgi:hypothetical protein
MPTKVYIAGGQGRKQDKRVCAFDWVSDAWLFARNAAVNHGAQVVVISAGAYTFDPDGSIRDATEQEMRNVGVGIMARISVMNGVYWWSDADVIERAIANATDNNGRRLIDQSADGAIMWDWMEQRERGHSPAWSALYDLDVSAAFLEDYVSRIGYSMREDCEQRRQG